MSCSAQSPTIEHVSWGVMKIQGLGAGRDMKLWPGGGRAWNWRESDTHHVPGIQVTDLAELVEHGAEILVLTRGMELVLQTAPETVTWLKAQRLAYHILETRDAARVYNELASRGVPVGGVFHSTC